jgi:chromosome segregation ATPase
MQKKIDLEQARSEISILNGILLQLKAERQNFNTMKQHVSKLDSELHVSITKRDDLVNVNETIMESFHSARSKHYENIQNLNNDKTILTSEISLIQKEINDEKSQNEVLTRQNHYLETEISKLDEEVQKLSDCNKELEQSRQIASDKEETSIKLHKSINEASQRFKDQLAELSKVNSLLLKEKLNVVEELNKLESSLETKTGEVQDLTRNNYSSIAQCTILEQQVHILNDQLKTQKSIDSMQEKNEKIKNILLEEINSMASKLKLQSEECMTLSKKVEVYKKSLDERNNFKKEMKRIIADIKLMKKVYVPVRGEQTDELLAEILRFRSDWVLVDVKRVEKGKYFFGSKEVQLIIEDNCLMVCFGRAKMDIEEFLEVYIPLELQKRKLAKK